MNGMFLSSLAVNKLQYGRDRHSSLLSYKSQITNVLLAAAFFPQGHISLNQHVCIQCGHIVCIPAKTSLKDQVLV